MSGTRSTPEESCPTVSTTGTLKSQLDKEFGQNGQQILTTYRKSRPGASPADLYVAITTARTMWLGSIEIAEKKHEQRAAPVYRRLAGGLSSSTCWTSTAFSAFSSRGWNRKRNRSLSSDRKRSSP